MFCLKTLAKNKNSSTKMNTDVAIEVLKLKLSSLLSMATTLKSLERKYPCQRVRTTPIYELLFYQTKNIFQY